jgi:hypothetical protein
MPQRRRQRPAAGKSSKSISVRFILSSPVGRSFRPLRLRCRDPLQLLLKSGFVLIAAELAHGFGEALRLLAGFGLLLRSWHLLFSSRPRRVSGARTQIVTTHRLSPGRSAWRNGTMGCASKPLYGTVPHGRRKTAQLAAIAGGLVSLEKRVEKSLVRPDTLHARRVAWPLG